jgi:preprotein translocase subunit SecF
MPNLVSKRGWFYLLSLVLVLPGLIFIVLGGLRFGIDFTGGSSWDLYFKTAPASAQLEKTIIDAENTYLSLLRNKNNRTAAENKLLAQRDAQSFTAIASPSEGGLIILRTSEISGDTDERTTLDTALKQAFPDNYDPSRTSILTVGSVVASEIGIRTFFAIVLISAATLAYLAWSFRNVKRPFRYATCTVGAMVYNVLLLIGIFAVLGALFRVEIDALFITALLTVVGFSNHDTIVVFDRIRENELRNPGEQMESVVNYSLWQTLARSINTNLTIIFPLIALYLFGGASIRTFVLALMIGMITVTYSSIFNASMFLVSWEKNDLGRIFSRSKPATTRPVTTSR